MNLSCFPVPIPAYMYIINMYNNIGLETCRIQYILEHTKTLTNMETATKRKKYLTMYIIFGSISKLEVLNEV